MAVTALMVPSIALDTATDPALRRIEAAVSGVLARLPEQPTLVVISAGREPLVEDVSALQLRGRTLPVLGAPSLVDGIVARGQIPRVQKAALAGAGGTLAGIVHAVRPRSGVVRITVPAGADRAAFEGATAALDGALPATGDVVLAVDGDLGDLGAEITAIAEPGSVGTRIVAALRATDVEAFAGELLAGPGLAAALAPARVALGVLRNRGGRFEVHVAEVVNHRLHVVGDGR